MAWWQQLTSNHLGRSALSKADAGLSSQFLRVTHQQTTCRPSAPSLWATGGDRSKMSVPQNCLLIGCNICDTSRLSYSLLPLRAQHPVALCVRHTRPIRRIEDSLLPSTLGSWKTPVQVPVVQLGCRDLCICRGSFLPLPEYPLTLVSVS